MCEADLLEGMGAVGKRAVAPGADAAGLHELNGRRREGKHHTTVGTLFLVGRLFILQTVRCIARNENGFKEREGTGEETVPALA